METAKRRITGIEFLRIPLILIAFLGHWAFAPLYLNADWATNLFFIIAGFFMIKSLDKMGEGPAIKKVYLHVMPPVVIAGVVWDMLCHQHVGAMAHNLIQRLFLLDGAIGNAALTGCPVAWFINAYFWGFVFWALLRKIAGRNFIPCMAPIVFLGYVCISRYGVQQAFGNPNFVFGGLLNLPFVRGITFIGVGMLLANVKIAVKSRVVRTALQAAAMAYLIYSLLVGWRGDETMLTFVLASGVMLLLMVENNDLVSNTLNKISDKITYVSRYTLYVYIFMIVGMKLVHYPKILTAGAGLAALGISIACAVVYYHAEQFIKRKLKWILA